MIIHFSLFALLFKCGTHRLFINIFGISERMPANLHPCVCSTAPDRTPFTITPVLALYDPPHYQINKLKNRHQNRNGCQCMSPPYAGFISLGMDYCPL